MSRKKDGIDEKYGNFDKKIIKNCLAVLTFCITDVKLKDVGLCFVQG